MARSLIRLSLYRLSYLALAAFAQIIHDGFVALALIFTTPSPTMIVFQDHIDTLNAAILKWGTKGNRGSKLDHLNLKAAAEVVRNDLRMLANYAESTKPDNPEIWTELGFSVKRGKSKPIKLQAVQSFHHFITREIALPGIKLRWKKPLM